jgi:hypothetical protein
MLTVLVKDFDDATLAFKHVPEPCPEIADLERGLVQKVGIGNSVCAFPDERCRQKA